MTTHDPHRLDPHRNRPGGDYPLIMTGLLVLCLLAATSAVYPGLDELIESALTGFMLGCVVGLAYRMAARWVRERIEDRADTRAGTRWRALRLLGGRHDSDERGRAA